MIALIGLSMPRADSVYGRAKPCREQERVTRIRDGRETVITPVVVDSCDDAVVDDEGSTLQPPSIPQKDFNVIQEDVTEPVHVQPDTDSVTLARATLDASNSDKDVHITSLKFGIFITSYAGYASLENCKLFHNGAQVSASGIARATVTNSNNGVIYSQGEIAYSLPVNSIKTSHHTIGVLELVCDLPAVLTEARITTKIFDDNFEALDSDGRFVDYYIASHPGHSVEVYSGAMIPGGIETPNGDVVPGENGDNGNDGNDAGSGAPDVDDEDEGTDDRSLTRDNRPERSDRR